MEKRLVAALNAEANEIALPPDLLARIKGSTGLPAQRHQWPAFWRARRLSIVAAIVIFISLAAVIAPSITSRGVASAMERAITNLRGYHGIMVDGSEVWREGDKFAVRYASGLATISDGARWWSIDPEHKRVYTELLAAGETSAAPNLHDIVNRALANPHQVLGRETIVGRSTTVLEVSAAQTGMERIWVDDETSLPLQWELSALSSAGPQPVEGVARIVGFTSFEVNPSIDPSVFAYQPPADYTVITIDSVTVGGRSTVKWQ